MNRIKLLFVVLVLGLAGALHAAAHTQGATHAHATARADKPSCCKTHSADNKQAQGQSCDMSGGCCCKSHSAKTESAAKTSADGCCACCDSDCCGHDKKDAQSAAVKTGDAQMSCDASGGCCKNCDCCKSARAK